MPVIYALVARNKTVLVDQQARSGNFPTITRMLLARIGPEDQKMSYVYDTYVVYFYQRSTIGWLGSCLAETPGTSTPPTLHLNAPFVQTRFSLCCREQYYLSLPH